MIRWFDPRSPAALRLWLAAMVALVTIIFLICAFASPFIIPDDARQFLAWMPRLRDPAAMPDDLIADYFHSVSPPLFRAIYILPIALGLKPLIINKLLVPPLLAATGVAAWRIADVIDSRPFTRFLIASLAMLVAVHDDSLFSATPRAFSVPLLLWFLDGLLRNRPAQTLLSLVALAAVYPAPALTAMVMLILSRITWQPKPRLDLSRRSVLFTAAAALAVGLAILPMRTESSQWRPEVTLAEARTMPVFISPDGRSKLVDRDGQIHWFCSDRVGFAPGVIDCQGLISPAGLADFVLFLLPTLWLSRRAVVRLWRGEAVSPAELIFPLTLVSATICWTVAVVLAFNLHLPSRYSQHLLSLLGAMALGKLVGERLTDPIERSPAIKIGMVLLLILGFSTPIMKLCRPPDEAAVAQIAAMPPATRFAGISTTLDFIPALTGRSVLTSEKLAVPYQLGYFRPMAQRAADTAAALATPDRATLLRFVQRYRVDVLVVDYGLLAGQPIPRGYSTLAAGMAVPGPGSWVATHAAACTLHRSPQLVLLDAHCLTKAG